MARLLTGNPIQTYDNKMARKDALKDEIRFKSAIF